MAKNAKDKTADKAVLEAVRLKRKASAVNPVWGEKRRPVTTAEVIAVEEDAGTHNITLRFPHDEKFQIDTADGIGIPARPDAATLKRVLDNMKIRNAAERDVARQMLLPTEPYPNIAIASPSTQLLKIIAGKLKSGAGKALPDKAKFNAAARGLHSRARTLDDILADDDKLAKLQATYDVGEILELFPGLVTKEELAAAQGPSHGNKTFCLIDYGTMPDEQGRDSTFMTISVLPEAGLHKQDSFGEGGAESLHLGETSIYLYNLKPGDEINVTRKLKKKPEFQLPRHEGADIIMVGQGNGAASYTTFLMELEQRRDAGEKIGNIRLMLAARAPEDAWGLKRFLPYLEDGTLSRIDLAVDGDASLGEVVGPQDFMTGEISDAARQRIHIHHGTRLVDDRKGVENHHAGIMTDANAKAVAKAVKSGGVYLAGGEPFHYSMTLGVAEAVRRDIHDLDAAAYKTMLKSATDKTTHDFIKRMRTATAPTAQDAEILFEEILKKGKAPFAGKGVSAHSKARIQGTQQGWTRRIAGKPLVQMCRSGKAPGVCPL